MGATAYLAIKPARRLTNKRTARLELGQQHPRNDAKGADKLLIVSQSHCALFAIPTPEPVGITTQDQATTSS